MAIPILMPALSPTMQEGKLVKWLKSENEEVSPGDLIAEVETDKAIMEVESVDSGRVGKLLVQEGQESVKVNQLIAVILEDGEEISAAQALIEKYQDPHKETHIKITEDTNSSQRVEQDALRQNDFKYEADDTKKRVFISPLAKKIALSKGIDITKVSGSGPNGRIIKNDVLNFDQSDVEAAPKDKSMHDSVNNNELSITFGRKNPEFEISAASSMRKIIANRLLDAKRNVPHFYLSCSINVEDLLSLRSKINEQSAIDQSATKHKISINDFIIKASAKTFQILPQMNIAWSDKDGGSIVQNNNIDISVAVATEGGLITPIIRNADIKSITSISQEMKDLALRARESRLRSQEFQGGSFSISNLGMYSIENFIAIINPPQSAILAVGSVAKKPVVIDDTIKAQSIMQVSLSCDHRVVDGAVAALWLQTFKNILENPMVVLI
ncbi:MAG: pyruvate dehydrogenase complex dihydrolipoamide acetyltransferase [Proteobacteria bacterium]|nr:pyruvate dehydrogenase complex dihydrolipoamide acetyltransferase [Pseudomonadota bacterium]